MPKDLAELPRERRAAEMASRLHALFDTALLGIFFYRNDGGTTAANAAFLEMVGYDEADVAAGHLDWNVLTPPEGAARDAQAVREILETGRCEPYEKDFLHRDGRRVPVLAGGAAVNAEGGVAFVLDLSERKRLERERRDADAQRRTALDAAELGAWDFRLDTGEVWWDARCRELFGVTGEAEGPTAKEEPLGFIHPEDRDAAWTAIEAATAPDADGRYADAYRTLGPDGRVRWVRVRGRATFAGKGSDRRAVRLRGVIEDVTDRERLERERAELEAIRRQAFEVAELGVCRVDLRSGTLTRDARAAEFAGVAGDLGPTPLEDAFASVHPDDVAAVRAAFERTVAGERFDQRFRQAPIDGRVRTIHAVGGLERRRPGEAGPPTSLIFTLRDVTDAVEQTRRTALLAEVLEDTPDLVGVASADGVAELMNKAGRDLLGIPEAELAGASIRTMHTDASNARLANEGLPAARRDGRWTGETELKTRDGRAVPVSQSIVGHRDDDGELTHYSTICRDLTDRVRAEAVGAARRECLSRLAAGEALTDVLPVLARAAEEHLPTPNLVCVLLRGGATADVPESAPGGGATPGETLTLAAAPSLPDSFKAGIEGLAADESGGACGAAAARNERVIVRDLATDPLCAAFREFTAAHNLRAVWSTPIRAASGVVLGTFAVYHDHAREPDADDLAVVDPLVQTAAVVIERAAADARDARLRRELAEGEARFRGTFENVGVGVAHVGFDGSWLRVNRRLCEIVGYAEDELRATNFQHITHDEDLATDLAQFGQLMRGEIDDYTLRKRYVRKDGGLVWIQLTVSLQRDAGGEPVYALSVIDDVSELVRREDELRELNATLELKVAARTERVRKQKAKLERLARGLAEAEARERRRLAHAVHDDLQQILAAAKMTAKFASGPDGLDGVVALLDEAINEARDLTQDLVPTVLYDRGPVPAVAALCRRMSERFDVNVAFDGGDSSPPPSDLLPKAYPHGPLLYQAARELLFNAVKHAPGSPVRVSLSLPGPSEVHVVVRNPTDADPPDPAADPPPAADAGFGLFSLREQVSLAGGAMTAGPTAGGEFEVFLSLPVESAMTVTEDADPAASPGAHALRVMIVDDHRIVRSALAGLLRGTAGIEVVGEAADGQEAVDSVERICPDAVVMDVTMPRMDGIEATRRVKELLPKTRVVGLSMHTRDDMAEAMCQAGAEAYVPKGGPPEELLRALRGEADPDDRCGPASRA